MVDMWFEWVCVCVCRQALFVHRQALLEQLRDAEDPALVLHLTSVLLFQNITHCMLHAPGRCVPHIIGFLQSKIPEVTESPKPSHNCVFQVCGSSHSCILLTTLIQKVCSFRIILHCINWWFSTVGSHSPNMDCLFMIQYKYYNAANYMLVHS